MALALSRPGSCRRLVSDLVRTLQRKKRSVIGRTRDWGSVGAAAPASPLPASSGSWSQQRWKIPAIKPSLASYRPHEPLMRLVAGSRAWHGGASAGSVRGAASAPLSDAESEVERGPTTIHPTAVVEPGAIVGEGVTIGPYCVVGPHVSLRDGVCLHAHVHVAGHTRIEQGTTVHSFASVGAAPQDRKYRGEPSALVVGRNCTIHNYAHLCGRTDRTPDPNPSPDPNPYSDPDPHPNPHPDLHPKPSGRCGGTEAGGGTTTIGEGCLIMSHCHVGHDAHLGDRPTPAPHADPYPYPYPLPVPLTPTRRADTLGHD